MSPRITVMLPVYNGAAYLQETLSSLAAQTFADFEVICADDRSTDDSFSVLEKFADADSRFIAVRTSKNMGSASPVLNYIIQRASGEFLVYSSQDDLFSPDWLEKMIARADETGADAVIPTVVFYNGSSQDNRRLEGINGDTSKILTNREAVEYSLDWTIPGNALWRADIIKDTGGYPDAGAWADEYAARRFFMRCRSIAFSRGIFFYRQDNPNAITKKLSVKTFDSPLVDILVFKLLVDNAFPSAVALRHIFMAANRLAYLQRQLIRGRREFSEQDRHLMAEKVRMYLQMLQEPEIARYVDRHRKSSGLKIAPWFRLAQRGPHLFWLACITAESLSTIRRANR